jgi:glyoxylase-like metal-dependent hydrolase (beta-lactamase superfamily II)
MDLNNPSSDFEAALRSLQRAIDLEPEIIIPAHGEPTIGRRQVDELLRRTLAEGRAYPEKIGTALGSEPLRLGAISNAVFPGVPFSMRAMNMMLVLTVLLHMENTQQVQRVQQSGKPAWVRC